MKDFEIKNCGCKQDPCKTYGSEEEQKAEHKELQETYMKKPTMKSLLTEWRKLVNEHVTDEEHEHPHDDEEAEDENLNESMHDDGQSNMIGPVNLTYIHQQIDEKMEFNLLTGIQDTIADAMNDPMGDICDYGAEAEMMGYGDLMEKVAQWYEDYITHCVNRYKGL